MTVWVDAARLPAAKAYAEGAPEREREHRHLRRRRQRRDDACRPRSSCGTGPATAGRTSSSASRSTTRYGWRRSRSSSPRPVKGLIPDEPAQPVAGAVDRPVHDRRHAVLRPGQPRPGRALGQQEADGRSSATRFRRPGRSGRRSGRRSPPSTPATSSGTSGTRSATGSTCGATSARSSSCRATSCSINSADPHCTRMASLLDPLIKNGTVPPLSVFTPDFAKKYGGANDKVLMMPGPSWYSHVAVRRRPCTSRPGRSPPRRRCSGTNETPVTTGQVGGGPWIISRHSKNLSGGGRLRHLGHDGVQPDRQGRPGPATRPTRRLADSWLAGPGHEPLLRRRPDAGAQGGAPARSGRAGTWSPTRTSRSGPTPSSRSWSPASR